MEHAKWLRTMRSLSEEAGVSFAIADEWEPFEYTYREPEWQDQWRGAGAFALAYECYRWETSDGPSVFKFCTKWLQYANTAFEGMPDPRNQVHTNARYNLPHFVSNMRASLNSGFMAPGQPSMVSRAVPDTEPRYLLSNVFDKEPHPYAVLGTKYHAMTHLSLPLSCLMRGADPDGTTHPTWWPRLAAYATVTPPTLPPRTGPNVTLPTTHQDRFVGPLIHLAKDRSRMLHGIFHGDTACLPEVRLATCHDGHFGPSETLIPEDMWEVPPTDWVFNTHADNQVPRSTLVYGARHPGVPLVAVSAIQPVRLVTTSLGHGDDYSGRWGWAPNPSATGGINWGGYTFKSSETLLLTCACSFPEWTSGPGCRDLICGPGADLTPPDQFWPYCTHTLHRMCNGDSWRRQPCGPAYDPEGTDTPSAKGVFNPFTNTWSCSCDTPFWDAHPGAMGFALELAANETSLFSGDVPPCMGGPPCTRMVYCKDHVDLAQGFDLVLHRPNAWINFAGEHAGERRTCNGHGSCGDTFFTITQLTDGSQVAGRCTCDGNYRGPGCSLCNTADGWWGYDNGCTESCLSRGKVCHGSGTCDSFAGCQCLGSSHRDPATRCSTCLLGYLVDPATCPSLPGGSKDYGHPSCRCIEATLCTDEASGVTCAGHGECISTTYNPRLSQRCLCDAGWSGFTCSVSTEHCAGPGVGGAPARHACAFPAEHRQCARNRLFLWPPDPAQTIADFVATLPASFAAAALAEGGGVDLGALPGEQTVHQAWPNTAAMNTVACEQGSGWMGASLATGLDWESGSAFTRGVALFAMAGRDDTRHMVLSDPSTPGGYAAYHSLSTGRLSKAAGTPDEASFTGPALCVRNNCQINVHDCVPIAAIGDCGGGARVRVFPVKTTALLETTALQVCERNNMVPLIRSRVREVYGVQPSVDQRELSAAYIEAVDGVLGAGSYVAAQTRTAVQDWADGPRTYTYTYTSPELVVFTTLDFTEEGRAKTVVATVLRSFAFYPYGPQHAIEGVWSGGSSNLIEGYRGWSFVPCSRHCVPSDMWGPDPDCNVVMAATAA